MSKQFYFEQLSLAQVRNLNIKTDPFQEIQFSVITEFSFIWPIDRTLSGATTPVLSGPGSDVSEGVLHVSQSFSFTGISPSDFFSVISRTLVRGVLPLCREAVDVFYSTSRLDNLNKDYILRDYIHTHTHTHIYIYIYIYIYNIFWSKALN